MQMFFFDMQDGVPLRDKVGIKFETSNEAIAHCKVLAQHFRDESLSYDRDLEISVINELGIASTSTCLKAASKVSAFGGLLRNQGRAVCPLNLAALVGAQRRVRGEALRLLRTTASRLESFELIHRLSHLRGRTTRESSDLVQRTARPLTRSRRSAPTPTSLPAKTGCVKSRVSLDGVEPLSKRPSPTDATGVIGLRVDEVKKKVLRASRALDFSHSVKERGEV